MDCKRVRETLFLFADNELEEELLLPFREHLGFCPECAQRLNYTRKLLAVVRERCHRQPAPIRLRLRILTSLPHRRRPLSKGFD